MPHLCQPHCPNFCPGPAPLSSQLPGSSLAPEPIPHEFSKKQPTGDLNLHQITSLTHHPKPYLPWPRAQALCTVLLAPHPPVSSLPNPLLCPALTHPAQAAPWRLHVIIPLRARVCSYAGEAVPRPQNSQRGLPQGLLHTHFLAHTLPGMPTSWHTHFLSLTMLFLSPGTSAL